MSKATNFVPAGTQTVIPHLVLQGAPAAIEFYKKAFGAEEVYRLAMEDGRIMHADLKFGDCHVFMADDFPNMEGCPSSHLPLSRGNVTIHMFVPDIDAAFKRAVDAGAKADMPPMDMFWGDRYGRLTDPYGHTWSLATHKEDLNPEEIGKNAAECMKQMAQACK